jgi:hypothetical protein
MHRASTQGDNICTELFEDLRVRADARDPNSKYSTRVKSATRVVNRKNKSYNISARRGDGLFGEVLHGAKVQLVEGFSVKRGPTVATEIGVEMKIIAKAMLKQIGRVIENLNGQVKEFAIGAGERPPISVAVVALNYASNYTSFESADRPYVTDGKKYRHPIQEAPEAKRRLLAQAAPQYDFFLLLEYIATNVPPYLFSWRDPDEQAEVYNALLTRLAIEYEAKF